MLWYCFSFRRLSFIAIKNKENKIYFTFVSFLEIFISLFRSKFQSDIILLQLKKVSFTFPGDQDLQQNSLRFCLPEKICICPSFLRDNFLGYRILTLCLFFFFYHFKFVISLSSDLKSAIIFVLLYAMFLFPLFASRFSLCLLFSTV